MAIYLDPITLDSLRVLSEGGQPSFGEWVAAEGSLPPPHVVARATRALSDGCEPRWVAPHNIVDVERQVIVGGCCFKGAPVSGTVEIGYGIAPAFHRQGYAFAGISLLLQMAVDSGLVTEVVAMISPANAASQAVAAKLGFVYRGERFDPEGELVQSWHWQCVT
ncbi:MAG: GNAT family N-acetyltransferase [Pseudomarimonas sp.]